HTVFLIHRHNYTTFTDGSEVTNIWSLLRILSGLESKVPRDQDISYLYNLKIYVYLLTRLPTLDL
uniref:Uncharacterized protein n=1 Tax=Melopsittacus undulatus TaxID=13146 RepID=A0A8V5GN33_MELUD